MFYSLATLPVNRSFLPIGGRSEAKGLPCALPPSSFVRLPSITIAFSTLSYQTAALSLNVVAVLVLCDGEATLVVSYLLDAPLRLE